MNEAFEASIRSRWPQFDRGAKRKLKPELGNEFHLAWQPASQLEVLFGIHPCPKSHWSSFGFYLAWSRGERFNFDLPGSRLRLAPPLYDVEATLRCGLEPESAIFNMSALWYVDCNEANNFKRTRFVNFDESYNFPWFPMRSPLHTFNPQVQGPEDYACLTAEEARLTNEDARKLAAPTVEELVALVESRIWPFVERELLPSAM